MSSINLITYLSKIWNNIGWTGAGVIAALVIGLVNFYFNFLRGHKYKLFFGYIKIVRLFTSGRSNPDDYVLMFLFRLGNIGHQAGVIEDIKITLTRGIEKIISYPAGKLPREAVENERTFKDNGLLSGSTYFYPFILQPKEIWESFFRFTDGKVWFDFISKGQSVIEIFIYINGKWECIFKEELSGGIVGGYCGGQEVTPAAGGAIHNYIYTKDRDTRRNQDKPNRIRWYSKFCNIFCR